MTDFDADEPVPAPVQKKKTRRFASDRVLSLLGVSMAVSAAFFPWYVFFNEEKFTLNLSALISSKEIANWAGHSEEAPANTARSPKAKQTAAADAADNIVTGTVPDPEAAKDGEGDPEADIQPFPASPTDFRVLHVSNGRAMIEDKSGIFLVQVGSSLPDLSKVATLEERAGKWVVITDKGDIYGDAGKKE